MTIHLIYESCSSNLEVISYIDAVWIYEGEYQPKFENFAHLSLRKLIDIITWVLSNKKLKWTIH